MMKGKADHSKTWTQNIKMYRIPPRILSKMPKLMPVCNLIDDDDDDDKFNVKKYQ